MEFMDRYGCSPADNFHSRVLRSVNPLRISYIDLNINMMIKKLTLVAALLTSTLFTACKKDKVVTTSFYMKAKKNGTTWTAVDVSATKQKGSDTVYIFGRAVLPGSTLPEETLRLAIPTYRAGTYQSDRKQTALWNTVGLDVIVAEYKMAEASTGNVTITDYNSSNGTIKGTFNVSVNKTYPANATTDKIDMAEGSFYVQVKEY